MSGHKEIQFHSLRKDELVYEVSIRSETPGSTVDELRRQMRGLMIECPSTAILETNIDSNTELVIINDKLNELATIIEGWGKSGDRGSIARAEALAYHLFHRVNRLKVDESAKVSAKVGEARLRLGKFIAIIEASGKNVSEQLSTSSKPSPSAEASEIECSGDKNLAKWNLKFNGSTDPRSFVERVEELQLCYGVSEAKLFRSAVQLFEDQALLWYRGIRDQHAVSGVNLGGSLAARQNDGRMNATARSATAWCQLPS
ncbi:uncharacterized protein LOC128199869 isoform X2 [Bicyclus anynana]|uniref:Uncharacterized protein LOC128199869 isoform X2 n=1 Tax=Bicyclus anynana TaxID=110368 RepID=A0ABM3M6M0_BICAN|nr:uncharacterized protein LOC128199869 isoform X2 [Bicyclus anynana]